MEGIEEVIGDSSCQHIIEFVLSTIKQSCVSQVLESRKPKKGMEFDSLDDGYLFYNSHAKGGGFGIVVSIVKFQWRCRRWEWLVWNSGSSESDCASYFHDASETFAVDDETCDL